MTKKPDSYNQTVSLQKDNQENKGKPENINRAHNIKKEALGPNTRRNSK